VVKPLITSRNGESCYHQKNALRDSWGRASGGRCKHELLDGGFCGTTPSTPYVVERRTSDHDGEDATEYPTSLAEERPDLSRLLSRENRWSGRVWGGEVGKKTG